MSLNLIRTILEHPGCAEGSAWSLLVSMANCAHDDGTCIFESMANLARRCGINRATAFRHLPELLESGLVIEDGWHHNRKGQPTRQYRIQVDKLSTVGVGANLAPTRFQLGLNSNSTVVETPYNQQNEAKNSGQTPDQTPVSLNFEVSESQAATPVSRNFEVSESQVATRISQSTSQKKQSREPVRPEHDSGDGPDSERFLSDSSDSDLTGPKPQAQPHTWPNGDAQLYATLCKTFSPHLVQFVLRSPKGKYIRDSKNPGGYFRSSLSDLEAYHDSKHDKFCAKLGIPDDPVSVGSAASAATPPGPADPFDDLMGDFDVDEITACSKARIRRLADKYKVAQA